MIKHMKIRIEADSLLGAGAGLLCSASASLVGKCSAGDLLGARFKRYLEDLEKSQSGATIIVKGAGTEELLKELAK